MLTLILIILSLIATFLIIYFSQYQNGFVLYWSIPLYFIGFILAIFFAFLLVLYIISLFIRVDKRLERPRRFHRFFIHMTAEFLVGLLRLDLEVLNKYLVPKDRTFLLVSNHQSNIDPIVSVWAFREFNLTYVMKDNIMKAPLIGRFLYGGGFLPLNRENDRKALETIVVAIKRVADGVNPIAVYPEGTRSRGPKMGEFRNGAFKIAQKSKAPIVVMALDPSYTFKKRYPLKRTKVMLDIIKTLEYEEYKDLNSKELGDYVHKLIEDRLAMRREEFTYLSPEN